MRRVLQRLVVALVSGCGDAEPPPLPAAANGSTLEDDAELIHLAPDSPMLEQLKVAELTEHELPIDEVVSPAKLEIDPSKYSRVLLPVPGRIVDVAVSVGEHVDAGDVLIKLDSPQTDAAIAEFRQAEADVAGAMAAIVKAERDLERVRGLYEHDAVAHKELLNAEAAHAKAKAELTRARAERHQTARMLKLLDVANGRRDHVIGVRAPISGKVLEVSVAPGEYHTDTTVPLMTIADLQTLFVAANVAEDSIRRITVGESVEIELVAFPHELLHAQVVRIADVLDPDSRTIEVIAKLPNPEGRFRPEMFGRVRHHERTANVPAVPLAGVVQRDTHDVVLVERSRGTYEIRTIETGARAGGFAAVTNGVSLGERIVVDGALLLIPQ